MMFCRPYIPAIRKGSLLFIQKRGFHQTSAHHRDAITLVLGSSGVLGDALVKQLARANATVIGADIKEPPGNSGVHHFIPLPPFGQQPSVGDISNRLVNGLDQILESNERLRAIIVASGGWEGDPQLSDDITESAAAYGDSINRMLRMNLDPVIAAGFVAQYYMANEDSLFVNIGATASLSPSPGMMGYGISKAATNHLIHTMGATSGKSHTSKRVRRDSMGVRKFSEPLDNMTVVGVLPTKIDTPMNRKAEPAANFEKWTKPQHIAKELAQWIEKPHLRPFSGSLVRVYPNKEEGADEAIFEIIR